MGFEFNWMQRYAGQEMVEYADQGRLDRRELFRRLVGICGSSAAAVAFLAACSSDEAAAPSTTDSATTGSAATDPPATTAAAPTDAPATTVTASTAAPTSAPAAPGETLVEPPLAATGARLAVAADDPDVATEDLVLAGPASDVIAYLARPTAPGTRAGVLVIHEIFGMNEHIRDVTRRLAKAGYLAIAVDLASRVGGTAASDNVPGALTQGPVEDRIADLDVGYAHLTTLPEFNGRLGVIGFCFGGGMTLSYAAAQPAVLAAVPYYGPTPEPASVMAATNAAILGQYGATDDRVNAGIPALTEAMAGKTLETRLYDGAGHAFNNDTGANYVEAAAVEAWTATLGWLSTHLR